MGFSLIAMFVQRRILPAGNRLGPWCSSLALMEWHIMQPRPACPAGVLSISRTGVSNSPLKSSEGSWHPAHHLDGLTPIVSCMYSMLFRYHWLLNEEK